MTSSRVSAQECKVLSSAKIANAGFYNKEKQIIYENIKRLEN